MQKLSLRLRVFLFFCLMLGGGCAVVAGALWLGYARSDVPLPPDAFVLAGIVACFGLMALCVAVGWLFDQNVARPIEMLSAEMRLRAHHSDGPDMDLHAARHLGDLAPAAAGLAGQVANAVPHDDAADIACLDEIVSALPQAVVRVDAQGRIQAYDNCARKILSGETPLRLCAPIEQFMDLSTTKARKVPLPDGGQMLLLAARGSTGPTRIAPPLAPEIPRDGRTTPLAAASFVVFDTETTGLDPTSDQLVQIGALRVLGGAVIPGEELDTLINPEIPIPPASTAIHHISDDMVADAPDARAGAQMLRSLSQDSILVAHNAPFDMGFLTRLDGAWPHLVLDTILISAVLFGPTEPHDLDSLCTRLGIEIPENLRHTALGDAHATASALCRMLPMLTARGIETVDDLLAETRCHRRLLPDLND